MNGHPVSLENLIDWLDGRLEPELRQEVGAHLAGGCAGCAADLAWLGRFKAAARLPLHEPPARLAVRAKALYRARLSPARGRPRPAPRLALALTAALLVLVAALSYLSRTPAVVAGHGVVASVAGVAEARSGPDAPWQAVAQGHRLSEEQGLRVAGGEATVTLFDGTRLELQPGAEVQMLALRSRLWGAGRQVALRQDAGTVRYDVPMLAGPGASFQVRSPTALVTVQGTSFVVRVESREETRVEVLAGAVRVAGPVDGMVVSAQQAVAVRARVRLRLLPGPWQTPGAGATARPSPSAGDPAAERPAAPTPAGTWRPTAQGPGPGPTGRADHGSPATHVPAPEGTRAAPSRTPEPTATAGYHEPPRPSASSVAPATGQPAQTPAPTHPWQTPPATGSPHGTATPTPSGTGAPPVGSPTPGIWQTARPRGTPERTPGQAG